MSENELESFLDEIITKAVDAALSETSFREEEKLYADEPTLPSTSVIEIKPRQSYKTSRGLGALLSNLRETVEDEPPAKKPPKNISEVLEDVVCPPADTTEVSEPVGEDLTKLNRKQRRALKFKEELMKEKNVEVKEKRPTVKPSFSLIDSDAASFENYKATFGFSGTDTNNYVRSVEFSPCGRFASSASQDRYVRVYDTSGDKLVVNWKHNMGGLIYDMTWHPTESVFASTSAGHPIHLWDSDGERLHSYIGKDNADAVEAATAISFTSPRRMYGAYKGFLKFWDVERGGPPIGNYPSYSKREMAGFKGKILSICRNPDQDGSIAVAGVGNKIVVYNEAWKTPIWTFYGEARGYTCLKYSEDGNYLYASARKGDIYRFDTRMNRISQVLKRDFAENHKTNFVIDNSKSVLYAGTSAGEVLAFDTQDENESIEPIERIKLNDSAVPHVSISGNRLIACSGERIVPIMPEEETEEVSYTKSHNAVFLLNTL